MTDTQQPKRGRPRKHGRSAFNFRISDDLRQRLLESAERANRSLTEEAEYRLNRDFAWEASKQSIEEIRKSAAAWRDAELLNILRFVGYQILREIDGRPTRVIVDLQSLLAEADGIARGLRPGFIEDSAPPPSNATRTADEERLLMEQLQQTKRKLERAVDETRAADAAAARKATKRSA